MTESLFPALISEEEFERVQALMERRAAPQIGRRALSSDYLLTGLLKCRCGAPMVSHSGTRDYGKQLYSYYHCQNKKQRGSSACDASLIPQAVVDGEVERKLDELLQGEEAYENFLAVRWASVQAQLTETEGRRRQAEQALEEVSRQATRMNKDYRAGNLSATLYEENRREIDAEIAQLKERVAQLERLERQLAMQLHERDAMKAVFDLAKRWKDLSMAQRKYVLRNVLDSVVAHKPVRSRDVAIQVVWKFTNPAG